MPLLVWLDINFFYTLKLGWQIFKQYIKRIIGTEVDSKLSIQGLLDIEYIICNEYRNIYAALQRS